MKNIITLATMALIGSYTQAQIVFNFDPYNLDDTQVEEIFDSNVLSTGVVYNMEVIGTYSIWAPSYYSNPCGSLESAPIFPSSAGFMTGDVSSDMEYFFAYPTTSTCSGAVFPDATVRIEISLDNGTTWFHPITADAYNVAHSYNYTVTGEGYPLGVRHISAVNFDDYGVLQFKLSSTAELTETKNESALTLYPNPSEGVFSFSSLIMDGYGEVTVYDMAGQLVYSDFVSSSNYTIDLRNKENGIYLVKYTNENSHYYGRVILQ